MARLQQQDVPFEGFLFEHYAVWNHMLAERYPNIEQRQAHMTRAAFIDWLCDAQDTFNNNDQSPRTGEMTWRPYLGWLVAGVCMMLAVLPALLVAENGWLRGSAVAAGAASAQDAS